MFEDTFNYVRCGKCLRARFVEHGLLGLWMQEGLWVRMEEASAVEVV